MIWSALQHSGQWNTLSGPIYLYWTLATFLETLKFPPFSSFLEFADWTFIQFLEKSRISTSLERYVSSYFYWNICWFAVYGFWNFHFRKKYSCYFWGIYWDSLFNAILKCQKNFAQIISCPQCGFSKEYLYLGYLLAVCQTLIKLHCKSLQYRNT